MKFAEKVVGRLKMFYDITKLFSGTDYVAANIYFTRIAKIRNKSGSGQLVAVH